MSRLVLGSVLNCLMWPVPMASALMVRSQKDCRDFTASPVNWLNPQGCVGKGQNDLYLGEEKICCMMQHIQYWNIIGNKIVWYRHGRTEVWCSVPSVKRSYNVKVTELGEDCTVLCTRHEILNFLLHLQTNLILLNMLQYPISTIN